MDQQIHFDEIQRSQQEQCARESLREIQDAFERALNATDDTGVALKRVGQYAHHELGMICRMRSNGALFSKPGSPFAVRMSQDEQNLFVYEVVAV